MDTPERPLTPDERALLTTIRFVTWAERLAELEATPVLLLALSEAGGAPCLHVLRPQSMPLAQALTLLTTAIGEVAASTDPTALLDPEPPSQRTPENN